MPSTPASPGPRPSVLATRHPTIHAQPAPASDRPRFPSRGLPRTHRSARKHLGIEELWAKISITGSSQINPFSTLPIIGTLREVGMSKILGNEWAPAFLHCGSKVVPTRFGTGCADLLRVCCLSSWICLNDFSFSVSLYSVHSWPSGASITTVIHGPNISISCCCNWHEDPAS